MKTQQTYALTDHDQVDIQKNDVTSGHYVANAAEFLLDSLEAEQVFHKLYRIEHRLGYASRTCFWRLSVQVTTCDYLEIHRREDDLPSDSSQSSRNVRASPFCLEALNLRSP
jgi:hypothetical protein